jgi:hypothetical protein
VLLSGTGTISVSLSSSAASLTVAQNATLTWSSPYATQCVASGGASGDSWSGPRATSGSASVTENAAGSYTYSLSCSSGGQQAQARAVTIDFTAAPSKSGGGGSMSVLSLLVLVGMRLLRYARRLYSISVHRPFPRRL